jgi:hypothetical protein
MVRFVAGLIIGLALGLSATTYAATCIGYGDLTGWTVTVNGEEACSDPSVDTSSKEIECEQ